MLTQRRPFQPEPPERSSSQSGVGNPRAKRNAFHDHVFHTEPEEQSSSDSDSSESATKEPSVFNFGWHSVHLAATARFSKEVAEAGKPVRQKRAYDNSARSSQALYTRSKAKSYSENGLSEERLVNVLTRDGCLCTLSSNVKLFSILTPWK